MILPPPAPRHPDPAAALQRSMTQNQPYHCRQNSEHDDQFDQGEACVVSLLGRRIASIVQGNHTSRNVSTRNVRSSEVARIRLR